MAVAFFAAEVGTGLFLVSYYFDLMLGMILGVALAGTLKPYFHLAHMGVPGKSIRALLRPDRSWISPRGYRDWFIPCSSNFLHAQCRRRI